MKNMEDLDAIIKRMGLPFTPVELQKQDAMEAYLADRFALFYAVGGGKTVVSTLVSMLWDENHTIILCPPILLPQWEAWLHSVGQKDTCIFATPKRTTAMLNHRWVIMSHAIFRLSYVEILRYYKGREVNLIVDEAQALKNPGSVLYKNVNQFISPSRRCLLLTATPTSKPQDSYTYIKLKSPQTYRTFGHWENLHIASRDIFGTITGYRNLPLLAENFAFKAATRTKQELFGHNLDPIYQPIVYDLSSKHLKLYNKLAEEQILLLDNGEKIDAIGAQRLRHKLQQIILNFSAFTGNEDDVSASIELLDQVIEEVDPMDQTKSKLVIWTYYKSSSARILKHLQDKYGTIAVVGAYGDVDSAKSVKSIMNDPACRMMVGQPSSVGVGLNLHHVCSEMIFLEQATTPMQTRQAIGRVDRAGQLVRPTIRFAQARGTVQLRMFQDLLNNDDLVKQVERTPKSLREEIFGL